MKIFKKLSALIAAVAIFGSTVFAADVVLKNDVKYEEGQNVVVGCYVTSADIANIGAGAYMQINYEGLTYVSSEMIVGGSNAQIVEEEEGMLFWEYNGTSSAAIDDINTALFTITFSVDDIDAAKVTIGEESEFYYNDTTLGDVADVTVAIEKVETEDPEPDEPEAGDVKVPATTISGNKKYSVVYDKDVNERVVLEENVGAATATAASVLVVNYLGDTKVANIYELLGISGEGSVDFASFTVKMVLPVGAAQTDNFSFKIQ